jgi:hypothetical protein
MIRTEKERTGGMIRARAKSAFLLRMRTRKRTKEKKEQVHPRVSSASTSLWEGKEGRV